MSLFKSHTEKINTQAARLKHNKTYFNLIQLQNKIGFLYILKKALYYNLILKIGHKSL